MTLADYLASLPRHTAQADVLRQSEALGGAPRHARDTGDGGKVIEYYGFDALATKVFFEKGVVSGIRYSNGFPDAVRGVRIGMHGREVVAVLGRAQRPWPMPHPNIILLYDQPEFLRIDVDRDSERVIDIYR